MNKIRSIFQNFTSSGNFLIILGIVIIIPFIVISIFNHPSADDYCFAYKSIELGFWKSQVFWYTNWTGRYFSSAILSISPLVYNVFFIYKIIPIALITLLFFAIYYLIDTILINLKKRDKFIFTLFILTIYFIQMPSVSQGIYWMAGSLTYQLANILTIFLFSFVIKLLQTKKVKYFILSVIFSFFAIGSNETSMLLIVFLLFVISILNYLKTKKINYSLLILFVFTVLFSIIVIKAPGNLVREAYFPDKHKLNSIVKALVSIKYWLINWLPLIFLFFIILFDYFNKIKISSNSIFNINPLITFSISIAILFTGSFPGFWSMGHASPPRTVNLIYLSFILSLLYSALVLFFYLKKRKLNFLNISPFVRYLIITIIFINLIHSNNNIKTVYNDLIKGKAYKYDKELKARYNKINNPNQALDTIFVSKLKYHPATIYFNDITSNPKNWKNRCYNKYWQTKPIIIKRK